MSDFKSINGTISQNIYKRWIFVLLGLISSIIVVFVFIFSLKDEISKK